MRKHRSEHTAQRRILALSVHVRCGVLSAQKIPATEFCLYSPIGCKGGRSLSGSDMFDFPDFSFDWSTLILVWVVVSLPVSLVAGRVIRWADTPPSKGEC